MHIGFKLTLFRDKRVGIDFIGMFVGVLRDVKRVVTVVRLGHKRRGVGDNWEFKK